MEIEEDELTTTSALEAAWDAEEAVLEEADDSNDNEVLEPDDSAGSATLGEASGDDGDEHRGDADPEGIPGVEEPPLAGEADQAYEKPPVSLSAGAREVWKDTPKAMQAEIAKREADYATGIQRYAEDAKRVQSMDNAMRPYQQLFAMNGGANRFMPDILQTASVLQLGAPAQKAQMVASLIQQFGVDIKELDGVLTGQGPPQGHTPQPQAPNINQLVDQRFQQYQKQEVDRNNAALGQEAMTQITAFGTDPKNEFYQDVKMEMADLLEMSSNRNQPMTLKQAYDKACMLNDDISSIVSGRTSQVNVARKLKAASSVSGSLGGEGGSNAPGSMREAIENAWGEQGQL